MKYNQKAIFGKKQNESDDYSFEEYPERREYNINGVPFYALNNNGNEVYMPVWLIRSDGSRILLQNTVMSLTATNTIVETKLVNRQGDVKEEISVDDWEINIKGIIVSQDMSYPDQEVYELSELRKTGEALGIENARTSLLLDGSEKAAIKKLTFPPLKGMQHIQAFEMDLKSDIDFKLIIE
ncbi:conserved hypothetical protein [uncultured Dysgonomonas sp.]|uniref:DUF6046 domain-containing protein n=1 Tax=uncultured Dysgonomonas sp. TaxID=206096 RepID=A0A212J730_9BACT|nr:DUF6046 domain-containing protein [uncultured Dysgonomonas sp.]SBV95259.1 conserved hypothetical protein [uncultured Dysgonomonas sp.]